MTLHPEEMENIESNEAERKTALIVDDEPSILEDYKFALSDRGYNVKTAMTLEQAKKYSKNFDLAIIDGLGGKCFEVYDTVNAKRKVILSGDSELVKTAKERGIEAYSKGGCIENILKWTLNFQS